MIIFVFFCCVFIVVIVFDFFKGLFFVEEVVVVIGYGIQVVFLEVQVWLCLIVDGGEGMFDVFMYVGGECLIVDCCNVVGQLVLVLVGIFKDGSVVVELVVIVGIIDVVGMVVVVDQCIMLGVGDVIG